MADVVQTLTSPDGRHRALVVRHVDGVFRVEVERWTEEWVPGYGKLGEFWSQITRSATFADTANRAAELAGDELRLAAANDQ